MGSHEFVLHMATAPVDKIKNQHIEATKHQTQRKRVVHEKIMGF